MFYSQGKGRLCLKLPVTSVKFKSIGIPARVMSGQHFTRTCLYLVTLKILEWTTLL